jgi:tryptophan synthase alpha chain
MSRLAKTFEALRADGRKAVIPYVVAGDPIADITVDLMHALADAGADVIELGVPFSDPMSEGPVIQRGHERALEHGIRLRHVIDMVAQFREHDDSTPVLLMGYANPVEHMGYDRFADRAAAAGVDALLTVDIPPEEVAAVNAELRRVAIDNILLVAPTTPPERRARIVGAASGFIYYVSLKGVTGAANIDQADVARQVDELRRHSSLPVCVGFGIKDGPSAATIAAVADGVVIGSALVQRLADVAAGGGARDDVLAAARELVADIRTHVDALTQQAA